jgi:hypothetical protein
MGLDGGISYWRVCSPNGTLRGLGGGLGGVHGGGLSTYSGSSGLRMTQSRD